MSKEFTSRHPNREQLTILMATKITKVRFKVQYNYKKCDGNWVDLRTQKKRHHIKDPRLRIPSSFISVKYQPVTSKSLRQENFSKNIHMFNYNLVLFSDDKQHIFDTKPEPVIKKDEDTISFVNDEEDVSHLDVD
ncbi:14900_t:CDS:2 [Funneliformis caledonium]|uniref:14900_t:CDS:1 n=1 Tax=Funneliformis caledonium TaxID=1117310 RepID=A0A9N8YYH5_9GLOM|nr:14900_t:CDS:2 [Funneliformis caledonium]